MADWLPSKREVLLRFGKKWVEVFLGPIENPGGGLGPPATRAAAWGIDSTAVARLQALTTEIEPLYQQAVAVKYRDLIVNAQLRPLFAELTTLLRGIKERWIHQPPLEPLHIPMLMLAERDSTPTRTPVPDGYAEADVSYPGVGSLMLLLRAVLGQPPLDPKSNFGYRYYWGVYPQGGASIEAATGPRRELMHPPLSGDDLPHSGWTRKKKIVLDFHGDSGKTVFFCVRYENAKGEHGPWGPLFQAVVP